MVTLYFNPHSIYNQCVTKEDATAGLLAPSRGHSAEYRRQQTDQNRMLGSVELTEQKSPDGGSKLSSGCWKWNLKHRESQRHLTTGQQTHHSCQHQDWLQISSVWSQHNTQWTRWLGLCFSCNPMMHCGPKTPTWWKTLWNFQTSHQWPARAAPGGRLMKTSDQLMFICGARSLLTLSHCSRSRLYSVVNYSHTGEKKTASSREEWRGNFNHTILLKVWFI